jgi:hypothetical protein
VWHAWDEGPRIAEDPDAIARTDLETICKLLTGHVRNDHFAEGFLAAIIDNGQILWILRRLAEIHAESQRGGM